MCPWWGVWWGVRSLYSRRRNVRGPDAPLQARAGGGGIIISIESTCRQRHLGRVPGRRLHPPAGQPDGRGGAHRGVRRCAAGRPERRVARLELQVHPLHRGGRGCAGRGALHRLFRQRVRAPLRLLDPVAVGHGLPARAARAEQLCAAGHTNLAQRHPGQLRRSAPRESSRAATPQRRSPIPARTDSRLLPRRRQASAAHHRAVLQAARVMPSLASCSAGLHVPACRRRRWRTRPWEQQQTPTRGRFDPRGTTFAMVATRKSTASPRTSPTHRSTSQPTSLRPPPPPPL